LNRYPIQLAKVQPPTLRDETLSRDRLLDWLSAKIHDRVILVLADAGYGKTTLLADFARRTRLRTLWYRLEDDDRDWIAFLNHLVAAGREHDPGFAPTTAAMLGDMSVGGPTRDSAIDVFLRELPAIAEHGAILILDDFHLVDDSADVRLIARELVARAPERLSIVFASRRPPTIPLARLRASGEVAQLGTDDLRFDATETRRLFAESYGRDLEPDVLADVVARTEGWAASLQLVQAALRDRTPAEIRRFVRGLSGADQELYDYLAEEVVGDLPEDLQQFLMRTSILQTVTPDLAGVVAEIDPDVVGRLTVAAERLTLLTRPSRDAAAGRRYHPLVREFLEARLKLTAGETAVFAMHRRAAEAAAGSDWRVAAHHYREARDLDCVASVIAAAIPEIMGSGQYAAADEFIEQVPQDSRSPGLKLVRSRMELQRGEFERALALSSEVLEAVGVGTAESDHALLNLVTTHLHIGNPSDALAFARKLKATTASDHLRLIADGSALLVAADGDGSLVTLASQLLSMATTQRGIHPHYFGVSMLNLAIVSILRDDPREAIGYADQAIDALRETSSRMEYSSALMTKATALTLVGEADRAAVEIGLATALGQAEAALEGAELSDSYDDASTTWARLESVDVVHLNATDRLAFDLQWARFFSRRGRHEEAVSHMSNIRAEISGLYQDQASAHLATAAYVAVAARSPDASEIAGEAFESAKRQGAVRWRRVSGLLKAYLLGDQEFGSAVAAVGDAYPWHLTFLADLVAGRMDRLSDTALASVSRAARAHPKRWRFALRAQVDAAQIGEGMGAARLLETIGERSDVRLLRSYARRQRRISGASLLGRRLARRLADQVFVEDQNRVSIRVGERLIVGSTVRRKVLALLCFLLTKPDLACTRDQVLEALWPDLDPLDAVNSLNQTVYFLRRVLEEDYVDDLSPGYLHHDSDLIWLDRDLVKSRSNECRQRVKALPISPDPSAISRLVDEYSGRFALDFEYEEWAAPYRDWLHASYLEIVERAVTSDIETGHFERGIYLARRVLDVDPAAEQVEVSLLRLYRASGAHAAAAEQYGHYAGMMRDELGLEPPPLESM
jgi:ATP/maltotriose-dependent transcriptional regulator MalT/DNA-binding SARP family transcriptional activator